MKRLLAILAIAAAGLIAACGQGGSTPSDGLDNGLESLPAASAEAPSVGAPASPAESLPLESPSS